MSEEILDADEVARLLKFNERTVKRMAAKGEIPGFLVGNRWRFRREAINAYIQEQEQQYKDKKD